MKLSAWLALPAIVTALACAPPAAAAAVTYTYTGVVDFGSDGIGLFGGGPLTGQAFTAVFTRDDALADDIFLGGTSSYVLGAQAVTAKLTINGVTLDIGGRTGQQTQYNEPSFEGFFHAVGGDIGTLSLGAGTLGTLAPLDDAFDYIKSADYHTLASLTAEATPALSWSGRFDFGAADPNDPNRGLFTVGLFRPTAMTASEAAAAVPEPAAWALMIAGFGAAGHRLRRQRRTLAA